MSLLTNLQAFISAVGSDIKALNAAISSITFPSHTGNARKLIKSNGSSASWDFPTTQIATGGSIPTAASMGLGEIVENTYDGKLYIKKSVGGVETVLVLVAQNPLGTSAPMWNQDSSYMWSQ